MTAASGPSGPRIGIDIGGTFTDGVLIDPQNGEVHIEKVLTTPGDLSDAFIGIVDEFAERRGVAPETVSEVLHASTIATNALLERKGAIVGLLVTKGFRDILEIGRQVRHELYNLFTTKPPSLVRRRHSCEVDERLDRSGQVVRELVEEDVREAARYLRDEGVDSIAICFLHSYCNPAHERLARELLVSEYPDVSVSISSDIAPEIKEYWRASTTCVNAYVGPVARRYLDRVTSRLAKRGFSGSVGIMHSGGGIEDVDAVRDRPFQLIESGPAAGVAAAAHFARALGYGNGLSFDMGGTTAKAGLILDGVSRVLSEFEVAGKGHSGSSVAKASGYPILGEVVDLVEVGAGGGSIAWIDDGGHLRVGPEGAGASPGPACYGLGGDRPTITDANLLLGRLDPNYFLGGTMALSSAAAEGAVAKTCADPLDLSIEEAATGIVAVADATMIGALRLISVERGYDPREFCLIAFGGAGPVHAASIARELEIPTVLILPNPGVASAWGLLLSDIKHDVRLTRLLRLTAESILEVREAYASLYERLDAQLGKERLNPDRFSFSEYVEARYVGQSSRLRLKMPSDTDAHAAVQLLRQEFHGEHHREFGYHVSDEPIEILTLGLAATAVRDRSATAARALTKSGSDFAPKGRRELYFAETGSSVTTPVYARSQLPLGARIEGPAVIEEFDSTTIVGPDYIAEPIDLGVLRLERTGGNS